jgi:MOSC domain-containing protein YiiM
VLSVNVGAIREIEWQGQVVTTGIWKHPVSGRVPIRGVNLEGDDQADRDVHGGVNKAVYAYAQEDYDYWRERQGLATSPGLFGENLTVAGIDVPAAIVGERWRIGSAVLEVAQPRLPCFKLGIRLGDPGFPKRFLRAARTGMYLRVVQEGDVAAGDSVRVAERPAHGITIGNMVEALRDPGRAMALRAVPGLPGFWRRIADGTADVPTDG